MGRRKHRSFDFLGNIAVVNFPDDMKQKDKKEWAKNLLRENKTIKTVLEKSGKFKGRLRKMETKHLAGEKSKEVLYRENDCVFRFNVDTTYFSPRLSNERKEIAEEIKKKDDVLVMFAGVAPYSIVIARNSKPKRVVSNEINREANRYAKLNVELNKVQDRVELLQGDVKKASEKMRQRGDKFDVIVMPRPQLKDMFLDEAFSLSKKGTRIYYYGFCKTDEIEDIIENIREKARENNKKIKILNKKRAGDLAPYKIRLRVDFKVLN